MTTKSILLVVTVVMAMWFDAACWRWQHTVAFSCVSPDGKRELRVVRNQGFLFEGYIFWVEVVDSTAVKELFRSREAYLGLIEAHWASNSDAVEALICNMYSGPTLVGYDFPRRRRVPQEVFLSSIAQQIARKYSLPNGADPLAWACSNEGNLAYRRLNSIK